MLDMILYPEDIRQRAGGCPNIHFEWRIIGKKRRLIGVPNNATRLLHERFGASLRTALRKADTSGWGLRVLPSAYGGVKRLNPYLHATRHMDSECFYITDLVAAYPSVSLPHLAELLLFLAKYDEYGSDISLAWFGANDAGGFLRRDASYPAMLSFLETYFGGLYGQGLAVGGPLSPYLMNLYCEVWIDAALRQFCRRHGIIYTRYVDDLVFSARHFIGRESRRKLRAIITEGGFQVNHRKSRLLLANMGQISITKVGFVREEQEQKPRLVFSKRKRRKLHGLIYNYLHLGMVTPEKVSGYIAEFLYYWKHVGKPTATDQKTFKLCKEFQAAWARCGGSPKVTVRQ